MADLAIMQRFSRAYENTNARSRSTLQLALGNSPAQYRVQVLGVSGLRSPTLIISAPTNVANSLLAITRGVRTVCTWEGPGESLEFRATVTSLVFEPAPLVYLGELHGLKPLRHRVGPRALTSMPAAIRTPRLVPVLVVDLSIGGAQVATAEDHRLGIGQKLELSLRLKMLGREYTLTLPGEVNSVPGAIDFAHPNIEFVTIAFDPLDEHTELVLSNYINTRLIEEVDIISRTLMSLNP
jgi:hypothetical protein